MVAVDFYMAISADVGTQRQTLLINQGQSKGKLNLDIVFNWTCHLIFDNTLWQCARMNKKKKKNQWMNCIRCDQRFE